MDKYLLDFLNTLNNPPDDIAALLKAKKNVIGFKGYGTPELEMKYMHNIFRHIQLNYPNLESFSWVQSNCYNDNYYHIELSAITVNGKLDVNSDITFFFQYHEDDKMKSEISFYSAYYPDPEEIEYAKEKNIQIERGSLDQIHWKEYWDHRKKKYQHLEIPCLKMLSFLKLLEINFSIYYFLYTFGNGVKVKFSKEGVTVTKLEENEFESSPLGTGMDLDEL